MPFKHIARALLVSIIITSATRAITWTEQDRQLVTAIMEGNFTAVEEAVAAGADVNKRDKHNGAAPLSWAIVFGRTPKISRYLIAAGADTNQKDLSGDTPLKLAQERMPEIVPDLIAAGAQVKPNTPTMNDYPIVWVDGSLDNVPAPLQNKIVKLELCTVGQSRSNTCTQTPVLRYKSREEVVALCEKHACVLTDPDRDVVITFQKQPESLHQTSGASMSTPPALGTITLGILAVAVLTNFGFKQPSSAAPKRPFTNEETKSWKADLAGLKQGRKKIAAVGSGKGRLQKQRYAHR